MSLKTPVLLLVYNRPDLTRRMLRSLEKVKPRNIYVVADGPKDDEKDRAKCLSTRILFDNLPWDCSLNVRFRSRNLGSAKSVSEGINWFFDQVPEGIIVEDDCIADPSFYYYCEALLEKYRYSDVIFHIGGNNFQDGKVRGTGDYYFSIFNHIWGWATWRRAWKKFEFDINPDDTETFKSFVTNKRIQEYFKEQFANAIHGRIDAWDFRWTFACWKHQGLSIIPNTNLVSNIGFGPSGTHTIQEDSPFSDMERHSINLPLRAPESFEIHRKADNYTFSKVFQPKKGIKYFASSVKHKIKTALYAQRLIKK